MAGFVRQSRLFAALVGVAAAIEGTCRTVIDYK